MILAGLSARTITYAGFAVIVAIAVVWEVVTVLHASTMTFGRVVHWAMRSRAARLLLLAFWIWLGWHLFARGSGAFKKSS